MTPIGGRKKKLTGWVRKSEWKLLKFNNQSFQYAGSCLGDKKIFDDDIKVSITIEELLNRKDER